MAGNVVNSFNEWDPLEEVIVGTFDGAVRLPWEVALGAITPEEDVDRAQTYALQHGGSPVPSIMREPAQRELEEFVRVLEAEGVTVRRPDFLDHSRPISTPDWTTPGGNCHANPRDVLIVVGKEIIEAPMAFRSRYFEFMAYRSLVREYWRKGAKWTAAPKPTLNQRLYNFEHKRGDEYVTTDFEPVWDAAEPRREASNRRGE